MIDLFNKSMKSIYMSLAPEVKCEIEMLKVMSLQFGSMSSSSNDTNDNEDITVIDSGNNASPNNLAGNGTSNSNRMESTVIAITLPVNQLNIYQMVVDFTIEFLCVYSHKFSIKETLNMIEPLNYITKYKSHRPMIALGSNINNDDHYHKELSYLRFVSLKNNTVIHKFDYSYWISSLCFKQRYFAVGLGNGVIRIYWNESLDIMYIIDHNGMINEGVINKPNVVSSVIIEKYKEKKHEEEEEGENDEGRTRNNCFVSYDPQIKDTLRSFEATELSEYLTKQSHPINQQKDYDDFSLSSSTSYTPIFDMTDNYLIYHISKENKSTNKPLLSQSLDNNQSNISTSITFNNNNSNNNQSPFDLAYGALRNLKEWSFKSITDYTNLHKSTHIKSNDEIVKKIKSNPININVLKLSPSSSSSKPEPQDKILVPFFQDGLSIIQSIKNGKYLIIGNKHSQLFFIYELYPQTNQKYSNDGQNYKIIYSLFRGNRPSQISSIDINKSYGVITSHRGTHHIYSLPHRDNQISEELFNTPSSNTTTSISGISSSEYLNQKITNGLEINKLKHTGKIYCSKIITIDKVYLDAAIISKLSEDSNNNNSNSNNTTNSTTNNTRFSSVIRNENFLLAITDNTIEIHLLYNNDKMILLKKIKLNLNEDKDIIYNNFLNSLKPDMIQVSKIQLNKRFLAESETTDKNYSIMQTNPLFTFNIINSNQGILSLVNVNSSNIRKTSTERYLIIECPIEFSIVSIANKSITMMQSQKAMNAKNDLYLYESLLCKEINYKKTTIAENKRNSIDLYSDMLLNSNKKVIINPRYEEMSNSIDIKNNFYNNKDTILETNIKNALETNIKDMINKNNTVNKPEQFVIQDNYYK